MRPDLRAAIQGVTAAESQHQLAVANGKRDPTTTLDYTHGSGINSASFIFSIEIPIFDCNQGEIARTHYAITQSQESKIAAQETVMTDVTTAYEAAKEGATVVRLYESGYLKQGPGLARHLGIRLQAWWRQPSGLSGRRAQLPRYATGLSSGAGHLHAGARAVAGGGGIEDATMKKHAPVRSQPSKAARTCSGRAGGSPHGRMAKSLDALPALAVVALLALALAGCSHRAGKARSNSTSSGGAVSGEDEAQLFTVPEEQMQHVQVVTVETQRLPRVLRLTGSVAYNNFETTPVITQVGGPVARIVVSPGEVVRKSQSMLYVASSDYAQARTNYLRARDALSLAGKSYARAQDLYAHRAIAEADLQQCRFGPPQMASLLAMDLQEANKTKERVELAHFEKYMDFWTGR